MFTGAYDRARALARAAIPSQHVMAVIAAIPNPSIELGSEWKGWAGRTAFEVLAEMGVATATPQANWLGHVHPYDKDDDDAALWEHRVVCIDWDQADVLMWSSIAYELGVTPQAPVNSKLVDVERGIVVNVYDDRGMDITALSAEQVRGLYTQFDEWLLDFDRPRMANAFKPSA